MKASRPKKVVTITESPEAAGWIGMLRTHANTALTVILLAAAVVMFFRWRMNSTASARQAIINDLNSARQQIAQLGPAYLAGQPPTKLIQNVQMVQTQANNAISSVINSSDADEPLKAQALVLRGDLYWALANLPEMPGSLADATLRLSESPDQLLQKSSDSYQQVVKDSSMAAQHESVALAHLGLAAIAENRHDWDGAEQHLKAVVSDTDAPITFAKVASYQLTQVADLKQPIFVAPPSGLASTQASQLPMPTTMTTMPAATMPAATLPAKNPASKSIPHSMPTTIPEGINPAATTKHPH